MELIFHYGDPYQQILADGKRITQPRSFIFGQIKQFIDIIPTGYSGIIAARFLPDGLAPFLDRPATELDNKAVGLTDLFGQEGIKLEYEVLKMQGLECKISVIESFLLKLLKTSATPDNITRSFVDTIVRAQGQVEVTDFLNTFHLKRRQLERRFNSTIGVSPKQLAKIVRLQSTLKMLDQKKFSSLTALAYENGYYDQAHFIRDFKEYSGFSPKAFFSDNLKYASLFTGTG